MREMRGWLAVFTCMGLLAFPAAANPQDQEYGRADKNAADLRDSPATEKSGVPQAAPVPPSAEEPRSPPSPEGPEAKAGDKRARQAIAPQPRMREQNWISLTGTVAASDPGSFTLDYGDGLLVVKMEDWDWYGEGTRLMPGEHVKVMARVDDDLYRQRVVYPDTVYAFDRQSFYYTGTGKEEGAQFLTPMTGAPPEGTWVTVSGIVTKVEDRGLTMENGVREIEVDTDELGYNPLDEIGVQRIKVGDRIFVSGRLDDDFFEDQEIIAQTVITLTPSYTLE